MTPVELLKVARYLMHVPEWWWQDSQPPSLSKQCMVTAVADARYFYDTGNFTAECVAFNFIQEVLDVEDMGDIWKFNDNHTHAECLDVFDKAIALGEAQCATT